MSNGFSSSATVLPRPIPGRPPAPTGGRGPPAAGFAPGAGAAGFVSAGAGLAAVAPGFAAATGALAGAFADGLPFIEAPQNGHSATSSSRTDALQAGQVRKSIGVGRCVETQFHASARKPPAATVSPRRNLCQ